MTAKTWLPVHAVASAEVGEARRQAHNAAQWLARLAHSYLPHDPAGTHLTMGWDQEAAAFFSNDVGQGLSLELDVAALAMQFREHGRRSPHVLHLEGRTPAAVEAWILVELLHRAHDRDRFSKALPFEVPLPMSGDAIEFTQEEIAAPLGDLSRWFQNASAALIAASGAAPSALRCDPNHFDLAVALSADGTPESNHSSGSSRAIRIGFIPGDEKLPEPFFYAVARREIHRFDVSHLPRVGTARMRDLVDMVLPAPDILGQADAAQAVHAFLTTAIAACRKQLAH
jgi:hypothetical protein